jgi:hypothetical protein
MRFFSGPLDMEDFGPLYLVVFEVSGKGVRGVVYFEHGQTDFLTCPPAVETEQPQWHFGRA